VTALAKVRQEFDPSISQPRLHSEGATRPVRLGDPKECRERAAYCAKRAAGARSPTARESFAHMAKVWLQLAIQLEEQWMLLDQLAVKRATGSSEDD